ncbi:MAG: aldehyde ferredoxin oxidoreductase [Chloroflexi bacterium HGW-Chloroflexi-1]|nr:MAG: aldehyde ferredoxin oxidoreductase [Chloroflexi bacterium HGW-Chloroflexi-1]
MHHGFTGKILRVDLTARRLWTEEVAETLYRLYPGGKALAAYLLLRDLPAGVDPLGPGNVLILANGLLTGAPFSTATRFTAAARSPLTGGFGESEAGGFWGPELKMAGFEAIAVTGRAEKPAYLWVKDGQAEIRDATRLWKRDPEDVQAVIREELGDRLVRVLQIGLGGENLVRFAGLTNELRHFNGRTGMGAVMGSKQLKAIAVRGSSKYLEQAYEPKAIVEFGRRLVRLVKEHPASWDLQDRGTPGLIAGLNAAGILPTRNFHTGEFEGVDGLRWETYEKELLSGRRSCFACAVRCKREVKVDDRYQVTDSYGGPEYETIAGFGSNCGIADLQAVAKANELCGRYTLDTISTSATVAFAMECFEHGLISPEDTGGLELRFGNAEVMVKMVDMIARREQIGDLLADGTRRAAEVIGGDAAYFAMHVKGQELPMHDPRGKVGVGLGYAINEAGADHLTAFHDSMVANPESLSYRSALPLGVKKALPARELSRDKAELYGLLENWCSFEKVIGLCYFGPAPRSFIPVEEVVGVVAAASGWDVTVDELLRIGERATNLARVFDVREGFSRKDDTLPERLFQPLETGPLAGVGISRDDFEAAMTALYEFKGWDPVTAAPTRARLEALGVGWAAEMIEAA